MMPAEQARERVAAARRELADAEWSLTQALALTMHEQLEALDQKILECRTSIVEVPSRLSLDHSAAKQAALKDLEECAKKIKDLRGHLAKLTAAP
jgi:uncharacterized protein involved in exopolysaccharide biosynthesis